MVICWRTPCKISVMCPTTSAFFRAAFVEKIMAGREVGVIACSGRREAIVLARMPLKEEAGHFLGIGAEGSGGGAVVKSDCEMMLSSVSHRAPGSSLETCSKQVTVFLMWRLFCLA